MNESTLKLAKGLIPASYVDLASQALSSRQQKWRILLAQRKLPQEGWSNSDIEWILQELAAMDSNNFPNAAGAGEREARVACELVRRRHFGLAHGIGRSGDVAATQPKAAGSSLMSKLCARVCLGALKVARLDEINQCSVLPMATGMSLMLCMLALRDRHIAEHSVAPRYVLWSRIDQKSCFKSILTAGFEPIVIELCRGGTPAKARKGQEETSIEQHSDELCTDIEAIRSAIERVGRENVLCILSTTSCFAPRAPDLVDRIAVLAKESNVAHVINNAYGLQSKRACSLVTRAMRVGRVDVVVQSTDKNFMVPVGGALIAAPKSSGALIDQICSTYTGRASATPMIDMFCTLLHCGESGYAFMLRERERLFVVLKAKLCVVAKKHGERVLNTAHNDVSLAFTLSAFKEVKGGVTMIGSMLYKRFCSGARVVSGSDSKVIGSKTFVAWGAHCDEIDTPYLTFACAIGVKEEEIELLCSRLDDVLSKCKK